MLDKINVIDLEISKNIILLGDKESAEEKRGFVAQSILKSLRDLIEHTVVLSLYGIDSEINYEILDKSKREMRSNPSFKFLRKFHDRIELALSHYKPNEIDAEMLMLWYIHDLFLIKKLYLEKFKHSILKNLRNYPLNLDPGLSDYYKAITQKIIKSDYEIIPELAEFYIDRVKPLIIENELYYEVTFRPATNDFAKFNKTVAYTKIKITENYALKLSLAKSHINVFDTISQVFIILDYDFSIRPCEIHHLGRIFDKNFKFNGRTKEYRNLMNALKLSKLNLLEVILLEESRFNKFKNFLSEGAKSNKILDLLVSFRKVITENLTGSNILRYLLVNINNVVLKKQLSFEKNNLLSGLYLLSKCKVFDDMPFCSSLSGHRPKKQFLFESIPVEDRKHEFLARRINGNIRNKKILYTPLKELEDIYNLEKEVEAFNSHVYVGHRPDRNLVIDSGFLYRYGAEQVCYEIFTNINKFTSIGLENYDNLARLWIEQQGSEIDSAQKKQIIEKLFSKSKVSLIYGSAGTGKTKMIEYINDIFNLESKIFLSNTNASVNNLKIRIKESSKNSFSTIANYLSNPSYFEDPDIIFIDECSTVSNDDILKILKLSNFQKIVLVGDVYQIESIDFGNWFYLCKDLLPDYCIFELDNTHRTEKQDLKNYWNAVRSFSSEVREIASRGQFSKPISEFIKNYSHVDDQIVLCLNYDGLYGINNLNRLLQEKNPNEGFDWGVHRYKIGDPIIFTESKRFSGILYNNLKGKISDININENQIKFEIIISDQINPFQAQQCGVSVIQNLPNNKCKISFDVDYLDSVDEDGEGFDKMVPFQVSYATSIHKSQGLEYKTVKLVFVDEVEDMVTHNIFYTAVTRAKENLEIYWSAETANKVYSNIKSNINKRDAGIFKSKFSL